MRRTALAATALSLTATLAACINSDRQQPTEPATAAEQTTSAPSPAPTSRSTRPLTYADDYVDDFRRRHPPRWLIRTIRYGEKSLHPGIEVMHMDLTDDGLALVAKDGGIYFADGSSVAKIGDAIIEDGMTWDADGAKTSAAGSLLAWFAPTRPDRSLVVYDTHERQVLAEVPTPGCGQYDCRLVAVVGDRVYWSTPDSAKSSGRPASRPLKVLDVLSEVVLETDEDVLRDALSAHPRAFVAGDSFARGRVMSNELNYPAVYFSIQGSTLELRRLIRQKANGEEVFGFGGFDTMGRRLNLRLPDGYSSTYTEFPLFQWLDDDRFAVMPGANFSKGLDNHPGYGDILVCDIAREQCTLADPGPTNDRFRLVPHLNVPN